MYVVFSKCDICKSVNVSFFYAVFHKNDVMYDMHVKIYVQEAVISPEPTAILVLNREIKLIKNI